MDFKNFLKIISRSFGNFLLVLSITLLLFSVFASSAFNNLDDLKVSLTEKLTSIDVLSEIYQIDFRKTEESCKTNPNLNECKQLEEIKADANNKNTENLFNKIKNYSRYIFTLRMIVLILFVLGFLFIFLGSEYSLFLTLQKISLSITLIGLFNAVYYKLLPSLITSMFNSSYIKENIKDIPPFLVQEIKTIVIEWFKIQINNAFVVALILAVAFGITYIGLRIYKKRKESIF